MGLLCSPTRCSPAMHLQEEGLFLPGLAWPAGRNAVSALHSCVPHGLAMPRRIHVPRHIHFRWRPRGLQCSALKAARSSFLLIAQTSPWLCRRHQEVPCEPVTHTCHIRAPGHVCPECRLALLQSGGLGCLVMGPIHSAWWPCPAAFSDYGHWSPCHIPRLRPRWASAGPASCGCGGSWPGMAPHVSGLELSRLCHLWPRATTLPRHFLGPGTEPRAWCMPSKRSTSELHPSPFKMFFILR